jgi:uncharacterized coiled-coil DUF342 family protein
MMDDITARSMRQAASEMDQAARNFGGHVDDLTRTLNQFSSDMEVLMHRLEEMRKEAP